MDGPTEETAGPRTARRPRHGEAFWHEMVMAWKRSGLGARRFCREQGLAVSTFGLWRKKLAGETTARMSSLAMTPDAAFVVARADDEPEPVATQPLTTADASSSRDRVTLSLAGVRIELTGAPAERIVRFVLGQLGGARC
jgi:sarcosine oxidase gamma subunit